MSKAKFKVGDRVRYIGCAGLTTIEAQVGAEAIVINPHGQYLIVQWDRMDKRVNGQWDGGYEPAKFEKVKTAKPKSTAPQAYKGNGKHLWEGVTEAGLITERLRVPGGWLYKPQGSAAVFVPMPEVVKHVI